MKIYTIHDRKAEVYAVPYFAQTDVHALRMFTAAVNNNDPNNMLYQHAEDFALVEIGSYNERTGQIDTHGIHRHIAAGHAVKKTDIVSEIEEL